MKNDWYKILLIIKDEKVADHVKFLIRETPLKILFVTADSLESFQRKFTWKEPHLIISDQLPAYAGIKEEADPPRLSKVRTLFIGQAMPRSASEDNRPSSQQAIFIGLEELDRIAFNAVEVLNSISEEEKKEEENYHRFKIQLHKVNSLVEQNPDFFKNETIKNTLEEMTRLLSSERTNRQITC